MTMQAPHRWKTLLFPLLACALAAPALSASTTADKPAPAGSPATRAAPKPLLWKVSDQDNSLYLLGSFHLLKKDDYPLSADVETAFEAADRVVFEVPPAALADAATVQKMQLAAGYGDDRKLSTVLPAAVREKLVRMLGTGTVAQLDGYEPWYINLSLLLSASQVMGFQADQGLDQHLMRKAEQAGKAVGGLETIDQQLTALDSTPLDEQIAGLREFLDNPAEVPRTLDEMHAAWRAADATRLSAFAIDEMRAKTPETYRLINVERNNAWLPQLRDMLDAQGDEDVLVVVGAMHLLGEDGVVEKLRAGGYEVERVCSGCEAK